jgi:hypothetical protein
VTVDQAQQLREKVIALRDEMGIPPGQIAIEALLDMPPVGAGPAGGLQLRMPI